MGDKVRKQDFQEAIDHLRGQLNHLEDLVDAMPVNGQKMGGADEMPFSVGDTFEGIVSDGGSGTKHGDPMAHTNGVVTFLNCEHPVSAGDHVTYAITHKDENHAKAVVTEVNPEDDT